MKIIDDNKLIVVDEHTVRFVDMDTFKLESGFKIKMMHNRYGNLDLIDFSKKGDYFVICTTDILVAKLYDTKTKKVIAILDKSHKEISCVAIDNDAKYVFSASDDGVILGLDIETAKVDFTLPHHVDTVNDIVFSEDSKWIATASYDEGISLFNLSMMAPAFRLRGHTAPVMKLLFFSHHRLISIDKSNSLFVWNIQTGNLVQKIMGIHDDVTQIVKSEDDNFLFIGTILGYILVYDMKSYELIKGNFIKLEDNITTLDYDKNNQNLVIGTKAGDIFFYNIYEGLEHLAELLKDREYVKVYEYLDFNPLLKYTEPYNIFDQIWMKTLSKAKDFLSISQKDKALALFDNFQGIPAKRTIINKLMKDYVEYDKFILYIEQNKLPLAYGLADKHPVYKESSYYKIIELQWKKDFNQAQKLLLKSNSLEKVKEKLAPYKNIVAKSKIINEMMQNSDIYRMFISHLSKKDFKQVFILIKRYSFLLQTAEYKNLMNYADNIYIKLHEVMHSSDGELAKKLIKVLECFDDYKDETSEFLQEISIRDRFFDAINENNIEEAYELLDKSDYLQYTTDGKKLIQAWEEDFKLANAHAKNADAKGVKNILSQYMKITLNFSSLYEVFSICYIRELEISLEKNEERVILESGIKNYVKYFGIESHISEFLEKFKVIYPDSEIELEQLEQGSLETWHPTMIVNSILD
jgi:WD40 repeat protein